MYYIQSKETEISNLLLSILTQLISLICMVLVMFCLKENIYWWEFPMFLGAQLLTISVSVIGHVGIKVYMQRTIPKRSEYEIEYHQNTVTLTGTCVSLFLTIISSVI